MVKATDLRQYRQAAALNLRLCETERRVARQIEANCEHMDRLSDEATRPIREQLERLDAGACEARLDLDGRLVVDWGRRQAASPYHAALAALKNTQQTGPDAVWDTLVSVAY